MVAYPGRMTTAKGGRPQIDRRARTAWQKHSRRLRRRKAELARQLGITVAAVCNWSAVPERHLDQVAAYIGVAPAVLRPDLDDPWNL